MPRFCRFGEGVVIADAGKGSKRDDIATFTETDGVFSNWMRHNQVSAVIVRPDRYVFAGSASAELLMATPTAVCDTAESPCCP